MVLSHRQREENALEKLLRQYRDRISGVLSCFDRILFKGYLPLGWGGAMEGLLIKDFKQFVMKHSERIKDHTAGESPKTEAQR